MSIKDKIVERGRLAPPRTFEIVTKDGDVLSFKMPHGGLERASYRRKRTEFVEMHENKPFGVWVDKKLIPAEGYSAVELGIVFDLHYLCTENWTQEDVLEMFAVNDQEMYAIAGALGQQVMQVMGEDAQQDVDAKKPSTPEVEQPTGGQEQA